MLAPLKTLLKRFFSDQPWTTDDDRELADLVGPGEGWWSHPLDQGFGLEFGWREGAFRLELTPPPRTPEPGEPVTDDRPHLVSRARRMAETFEESVIPEPTPNPRTIRFVTGPIHTGPSRWYESDSNIDDPRVASLFAQFDDVENVLVGPDFVAVGLRRPDQWEELLVPVLRVVAAQFASTSAPPRPFVAPAPTTTGQYTPRQPRRPGEGGGDIERAWRELGRLRADQPADLARIVAALSSPNLADRQVAARVLVGADPVIAESSWDDLLADPSRTVRRATVDAMVDTRRAALRPLLERALRDTDPWTRWKALKGLVDLGIDASRDAVTPLTADTDFRVRLEAATAIHHITDT